MTRPRLTLWDLLLKALGLVCRVRGCRLAATHAWYCMGHKHLRWQKVSR